jgi:class 3 adenylate cyclase
VGGKLPGCFEFHILLFALTTPYCLPKFADFATDILNSADFNAKDVLGKLKSISNSFTSYSMDTARSWPNTTLPHFDIRTTNSFEKLADFEFFLFAPVVEASQTLGFEEYAWDHQGWIQEDLEVRGLGKIKPGKIPRRIYSFDGESSRKYNIQVPIWQVAPVPTDAGIILLDLYSQPSFRRMIDDATISRHVLLSEVVDRSFLSGNLHSLVDQGDASRDHHPRSYAIQPVYQDFSHDSKLTGFVFAVVSWDTYFLNVLPKGTNGFIVQIEDTCGTTFSYRLDGPEAIFLGEDFSTDPDYDHLVQTAEFVEFARFEGVAVSEYITQCSYRISVHPSKSLQIVYETSTPAKYTSVVVVVFFFTAMVFFLFNYHVQRRQDKVFMTAQKTSAIVSSLFPKNVQKRMMADAAAEINKQGNFSGKAQLKNYLGDDDGDKPEENSIFNTKPIADFFPETTIMFGDIVGFTAWSSTREPSQVFTLLESIYHDFDQAAKQRRVFKVETVGDCYVAVVGLPDPRKDHALVMARFARQCLYQLSILLKKLEVSLGPDTADLAMRIGLHSGPVTAGVLRGERSRFQLFGDTMNTASRMESTGARNKIQVSEEVAELLLKAGKAHWIQPRQDLVIAKGKGEMQTYWLEVKGEAAASVVPSITGRGNGSSDDQQVLAGNSLRSISSVEKKTRLSEKVMRMVSWNTDLMSGLLEEMVARRSATQSIAEADEKLTQLESSLLGQTENMLTEVQEIIKLPIFKRDSKQSNPKSIMLKDKIVHQLRNYIEEIAKMYHDNPFHNFEHASHVTVRPLSLLLSQPSAESEHVLFLTICSHLILSLVDVGGQVVFSNWCAA